MIKKLLLQAIGQPVSSYGRHSGTLVCVTPMGRSRGGGGQGGGPPLKNHKK